MPVQAPPPTPSSTRSTTTADLSLDNATYVLIILVILIPIGFTIILCSITYCVYRYNQKRSIQARRNANRVLTSGSNPPIATVIYNPQHNPYSVEELPPAYDSLGQVKKDLHFSSLNDSAAVTIIPSAPTPPPPAYVDLVDRNH